MTTPILRMPAANPDAVARACNIVRTRFGSDNPLAVTTIGTHAEIAFTLPWDPDTYTARALQHIGVPVTTTPDGPVVLQVPFGKHTPPALPNIDSVALIIQRYCDMFNGTVQLIAHLVKHTAGPLAGSYRLELYSTQPWEVIALPALPPYVDPDAPPPKPKRAPRRPKEEVVSHRLDDMWSTAGAADEMEFTADAFDEMEIDPAEEYQE